MSTTGKYDDCRGTLVPGPNGSLFCQECGWRVEPGSPKYRTPKPTALEEKDAEIASLRVRLANAAVAANQLIAVFESEDPFGRDHVAEIKAGLIVLRALASLKEGE